MATKKTHDSAEEFSLSPPDFPSARYFQIHFQYLQEIIGDLKQQVDKANLQIAELHAQIQSGQNAQAPQPDNYSHVRHRTWTMEKRR